jgi:hypothetical protein
MLAALFACQEPVLCRVGVPSTGWTEWRTDQLKRFQLDRGVTNRAPSCNGPARLPQRLHQSKDVGKQVQEDI